MTERHGDPLEPPEPPRPTWEHPVAIIIFAFVFYAVVVGIVFGALAVFG